MLSVQDSTGGGSWLADDLAETTLANLADCIYRDPLLEQLSTFWRHRGTRIVTLRDLFLCYFRDVKLICIPNFSTSTPSLLMSQWLKLDKEIQNATDKRDGVWKPDMEEVQKLCHSLTQVTPSTQSGFW
jgi:hypothetical protein